MKIAAVAALLWAIAAPAWATPVTVGMTFIDPAGAAAGSGSFAFDPAAAVDLYFDGATFCAPTPADPACAFAATWTPITSFQWSIYGVTFGAPASTLFLEGFIEDQGRGASPGLYPGGGWLVGDTLTGESLSIAFSSFSAPGAWSLASYQLFDLDPVRFSNAAAAGSILFSPVEIPLPPAALLFIAGLAGASALRRHPRAGVLIADRRARLRRELAHRRRVFVS